LAISIPPPAKHPISPDQHVRRPITLHSSVNQPKTNIYHGFGDGYPKKLIPLYQHPIFGVSIRGNMKCLTLIIGETNNHTKKNVNFEKNIKNLKR
jgi:hypothetical protein